MRNAVGSYWEGRGGGGGGEGRGGEGEGERRGEEGGRCNTCSAVCAYVHTCNSQKQSIRDGQLVNEDSTLSQVTYRKLTLLLLLQELRTRLRVSMSRREDNITTHSARAQENSSSHTTGHMHAT